MGAAVAVFFYSKNRLNKQQEVLNDQQIKLNNLLIDEQDRSKKAKLFLSITKSDEYSSKYHLFIDNRGKCDASNIKIICNNEDLFDYPNYREASLPTLVSGKMHMLLYNKFLVYKDKKLDFEIHWDDDYQKKNMVIVSLDPQKHDEYLETLFHLYPEIPGYEEE